jgi:hypothetical protein
MLLHEGHAAAFCTTGAARLHMFVSLVGRHGKAVVKAASSRASNNMSWEVSE